jgi:YD repeat-containing protein
MLLSNSISAAAADVLYFYDDAGRLARTITGSQVIDFQYDEVGNLKGTVTGSNDTQPPTLTAIDPSIMFPGASFAVTFSGTVQEYD